MGYQIETKYVLGEEIRVPMGHCKTEVVEIIQVLVVVNNSGSEIRYYFGPQHFVTEEEVIE